MELGIVSNCWRAQLEGGAALDDLIAEAIRRGYQYVELRQGCLGAYESAGDAMPDVDGLWELPGRFPEAEFNLALAIPYLGESEVADRLLFPAGVRAAVALGKGKAGHLRLVDTETPPEAVTAGREEVLSERLAGLAAAAAGERARLSVENARQPWAALRRIFIAARERLGERSEALGLCYDPCNLLSAADHPDPQVETERLPAEEIALFHFKQSRGGAAISEVGPGDVDWPAQLAALERIGYLGPRLFEIPPGLDIWERLERSRGYLNGLEGRG